MWADPTLSRTVQGRSARVPYELYVAFVDTPDVTAAAARHLGLAKYEVEPLSDDRYRATDNDGSTGMYQVLVRESHRRVVLSWGEHTGSILGTISGSALTVIKLHPGPAAIEQTLEAYVRIDNALAAVLARILVTIFGSVADRKLAEGSTVTARVAEWAVERSDEFCDWLAGEPVPAARRARFRALASGCR